MGSWVRIPAGSQLIPNTYLICVGFCFYTLIQLFEGIYCTIENDTCGYDSNGDSKIDKNWARDWQVKNPKKWYNCGPNEVPPLNSNLKAYATWWMFARIAGWNGSTK
jgi:hypothetical protein